MKMRRRVGARIKSVARRSKKKIRARKEQRKEN